MAVTRLLLDTNVLIRALGDPTAIPPAVRETIITADEVRVSLMSVWEVAIKFRIGKLALHPRQIFAAMAASDFHLLPIEAAHLLALDRLPHPPPNKDPFDHLLLAQALHEGLTLVTSDRRLHGQGVPTLAA